MSSACTCVIQEQINSYIHLHVQTCTFDMFLILIKNYIYTQNKIQTNMHLLEWKIYSIHTEPGLEAPLTKRHPISAFTSHHMELKGLITCHH